MNKSSAISPGQFTTFGDLLKYLRRRAGLTQRDLSIAVGYSESQISRLEQNQRIPSPTTLIAQFVPALHIESESEWVKRLIELTEGSRQAGLHAPDDADIPALPHNLSIHMAKDGETAVAHLPTGTVTFLFTDIEGSTHLWERNPETMKAALARHDAILRQTVEAHHGRVVKGRGDGCLAVFETALDGVLAALTAQRALSSEAWDELAPHTLRVRMALHTGEAEARAGDYYGPTLNRAARLSSVAHGGQILLSAITAGLVRDQLRDGATLLDLGEHRLKDLARPEHIYQFTAPNLPAHFPPLTSLNASSNNLPIQLTSFIGRANEKAAIRGLLNATRLVTLTGFGGCGKTRLALQVASDVQADFAHGVWLIELAPLADPTLLLPATASVFGLREIADGSLPELVTNYLRARHLLLILDNCEHLIEACARLADDLLRACPHLKILASSREPLGVPGEAVYHVPGLSLPDISRPTPDALRQCEAGELFVERAKAALARFELTTTNAPAVAQICHRLDGIPLAIELAAARARAFTPEEIAVRLDDCFRLLISGNRTALPRQQTLRALMDWSYDLLTEPERVTLQQLSVFASGWTIEAAESVCSSADIVELLAHLVDKSLVVFETQSGPARYKLLEAIRQYTREKLFESGAASDVQDRHLAYYLSYAEQAEPGLRGLELVSWLDRLELEHDNLRAALDWALENQPVAAMRLGAALSAFWGRRGFVTEGSRLLTTALARTDNLSWVEDGASRINSTAQARALINLASDLWLFCDVVPMRAAAEVGLALARQNNDSHTLALALGIRGMIEAFSGDPVAARAAAEEGKTLSHQIGDLRGLIAADTTLTMLTAFVTQNLEEARVIQDQVVHLARQTGDPWIVAQATHFAGVLAGLSGDLAEARLRLEESAVYYQQLGDHNSLHANRSDFAHVLRGHGDYEQAAALYRETIVGFQQLGRWGAVAHQLECFAFIAEAQGQSVRAAKLFGAAEAAREAYNSLRPPNEQAEYDQAVSKLRAGLDERDFASAWAAGRALTTEQAVDYALAQTHSPEA